MRPPLNPRQQAMYDRILEFWREHSYGPTFNDLQIDTVSKGHSQYVVTQLIALGYLTWHPNVARSIVPAGLSYSDLWQRVEELEPTILEDDETSCG